MLSDKYLSGLYQCARRRGVPSSLIAQLFGGAAVATVRRSYPLWGVILARLLGWELAPNNTETKGGYD